MARRYQILDVFTDTKLAGNPLAVVLDGDGLDAPTMQAIAREFNLSETVFVAAPRDTVNSAALRIFTPTAELAFAGHPTVGTAIALASLHAADLIVREDVGLVLEEGIGPVSCSVRHRRGEAAHARFEVPRLAERWADPAPVAEIALALGIAAADIGFSAHHPTCYSAGNPATFVPVASLEALGRARTPERAGERAMYYLYTPAGAGGSSSYRSRMLSSGYGVPEDPATGSLAAAFPAVLHENEKLADGDHECWLHQGVEMGRPSRIGVTFSLSDGRLTATAIGGAAVLIAEGKLAL